MKNILSILALLVLSFAAEAAPNMTPQWGYDSTQILPNGMPLQYKIGSTWSAIPLLDQVNPWTKSQNFTSGAVYYGVPNAAFDGVTDDTAAINARISSIKAAGGGTLYLQSGVTYIANPIILKSYVRVIGANSGTTILCNAVCIGQAPGSQLVQSGFTNVKISMGAGNTSDAMLFTSVQDSNFGDIIVSGTGFNSVINITSNTVSSYDDPTIGSNSIFNNFHDINAYFAKSTYGIYLSGKYGLTPPAPSIVVTLNDFKNIQVNSTNSCTDSVRAADSNNFYSITCRLSQTGARAFVDADDPSYASVNNYVNNNRYYSPIITTSISGASFSFFSGNWTFGVEAYGLLQDVNPVLNTVTPVNYSSALSYCIRGQNIRPEGITPSGNLYLSEYCKGYYGKDNYLAYTALEGFNVSNTITSPYDNITLNPSTDINGGNVNLPCGVPDGHTFSISSLKNIISVTATPCSGDSISIGKNPFRMQSGNTVRFKYLKSSKYWVTDSQETSLSGNHLNLPVSNSFNVSSSTLDLYNYVLLQPSANLSLGTVTLPCNSADSTDFTISTTYRINALTISGCASPSDSVSLPVGKNPMFFDAGGTITLKYSKNGSNWTAKNASSGFGNISSIMTKSNLPSISSCGTSPAIVGPSGNSYGLIRTGTGNPTSCQITFADEYPNSATCTVSPFSNVNGNYYLSGQTKSGFTINFVIGQSNIGMSYICVGY